jgi:glycosyltransferase involved in cell wall biosynthesis
LPDVGQTFPSAAKNAGKEKRPPLGSFAVPAVSRVMAPRLLAPCLLICNDVAPFRIPVAVFLTSFDSGGTERQMTELIRRLDRRRFDVHVACFHRKGVWLPRIASLVSEVAEFPIRSFRSPSTLTQFAAFARWCRARRIAVVQAADIYANAFALPAAALARVPVRVGSRREVHPSRGRGLGAAQRFGYAAAHRIVTNSSAGAARLQSEGIPSERIAIVRNGLDLAAFGLRSSPPRQRRIVSVGRLRPEKAHEVLLAAMALLRPSWPSVRLRLVGDGPREAALRQLAGERGLLDCVEFLGHRDDVPAILRDADVFVLPSRTEASPNAVLEAMAAGLPVVASNVGGIPEAITPGVTGMLVPPDDANALAGAIGHLFDNPSQAERLGLAGRRHVEEHYSFGRMVGAFESLYLAELTRRGYHFVAPGLNTEGLQTVTF